MKKLLLYINLFIFGVCIGQPPPPPPSYVFNSDKISMLDNAWGVTKYETIKGVISEEEKKKTLEKLMKPIVQYTKNGVFIRDWKDVSEASKETGINSVNINQACNGKLKISGGFIWKYKNN